MMPEQSVERNPRVDFKPEVAFEPNLASCLDISPHLGFSRLQSKEGSIPHTVGRLGMIVVAFHALVFSELMLLGWTTAPQPRIIQHRPSQNSFLDRF